MPIPMERTIYIMDSGAALNWTDITGHLPKDCKYHIPYATTEQALISEGTIIRHSYSHVLYFMEIYEFRLHRNFRGSFRVTVSSLFLFVVLFGKIAFSLPDHKLIRTARKDTIYATRNEPGEFLFELPPDDEPQCLCNFTIRPSWLTKEVNDYMGLRPFLSKMESEASLALYSYMPACKMIQKIKDSFKELFSVIKPTKDDLELAQLRIMKKIVAEYQKLALVKLSHPVYQIRDYLESHYQDPDLNTETLISAYNITKSTLIRNFKKEFNTTPHLYLTGVRMQHAYQMLIKEKKTLIQVYIAAGYRDLHSFSIQFKNSFHFPPSDHH